MARRLEGKVVAVTGASSGIGRATAIRFGGEGCAVVLIARGRDALEEVAREVREAGGRALVIVADVSDAEALEGAARQAVERFGGLDVWVNDAGVSLFGPLEVARPDLLRRVVETNLLGMLFGARAAIPHLRVRGGVLINVSSVYGVCGAPLSAVYAATKWGIRGLAFSLRQELRGSGVDVCTVLPASVDTPIFGHAANLSGWKIQPIRPVYPTRQVAAVIVRLARHPRREVVVGWMSRGLVLLRAVAPSLFEALSARLIPREQFQDRPAEPTEGNLYEPLQGSAAISGGWLEGSRRHRRSRRGRVTVLVGAAALGALAVARSRR